MINVNIEVKNVFSQYCEDMSKQLKMDKLPIIIAGDTMEEQFIPFFENHDLEIDRIYDRDPLKRGVLRNCGNGKRKGIIGPSDIEELYTEYNAVVMVPYYTQIVEMLNSLPVKPKRIFYTDFAKFHMHPSLFLDKGKEFISNHMDSIREVYEFLEDDYSRDVVENLLNYWISGDALLVNRYREMQRNQYLDCFDFSDEEVFVNVGACDGRYSKLFAEKVRQYRKIYNLECDPVNFEILKENLSPYPNMEFMQVGVWDKKDVLHFHGMGNSASCIGKKGDIEVQVDSIDNMFSGKGITFIKADIEGAEYNLLRGGYCLLKKDKPKLAICCYHQVEDLIKIPKMIKEINAEYRIKMRHYTDTLTETVCYAY